jgi:TPR repeat protein
MTPQFMKTIKNSILTIGLLISTLAFAQNDLKARIEFEEAEKQFNEGNFADAVDYLEKTEALIGKWTPKVSFMKIESLNNVADLSNLENENTKKLIKEVKLYMDYSEKQKDNVVIEKFKVVYAIDEQIKILQKDEKDFRMPEFMAGLEAYREKNYSAALDSWTKAAAKGNGRAMVRIGFLYDEGEGVAKSEEKALEWYRKGDKAGNPGAAFYIGSAYYYGMATIQQDYTKAMEWYKKAANKGDADAMGKLSYMYRYGKGVQQDAIQGFEWSLKGAKKGQASAMYWTARAYDTGEGVEKDESKATDWFLKGADKGDGSSMYNIGIRYYYGISGFTKDYAKAMEWYLKAADKENRSAMRDVGEIYQKGQGVPQDYVKALEWYAKAVEKGEVKSLNEMANIYEEGGYGVKRDKRKATELRAEYEAKKDK